MPKRIEIRIAGLGGQGVVLAGQILGRAAVYDGKHVVQTQSYGAEARGSAAKSEVVISDEKIGFPIVRKCNVLVAMNQIAFDKNKKDIRDDGILLVEEDVKIEKDDVKARIFQVPATRMAETAFKSKMYANVVILGALVKATSIVSNEAMDGAIADSVPAEAKQGDINAFRLGLQLVKL